ncbi:MAG TPA: glycosyltransferase family 39 protein [Patescibacteria group bacterium]|nr:glycosyltransferase family 39 protein [Patescibacteria group bacterium]
MHRIKNIIFGFILTVCFLLQVLAIFLVKQDASFSNVWLPFWLHIGSELTIFVVVLLSKWGKIKNNTITDNEIVWFGFLMLFVELISFLFLTQYPYVSVGDELRDGGLNAMQIANGQIQNIFDYGTYAAHGLIIPTIASFFYKFFGSSVLTYRFPVALLACLDVVILYVLLKSLINRVAAFFGALTLAVLPFQLFFSRTQIVVAFNTFWTCIILLASQFLFESNSLINYIFLGSALGFASEFHAGVRVVAVLVLLLVIIFKIIHSLRGKIPFLQTLFGIILMVLFAVVSFGPQILFTSPSVFFHTGRFVLQTDLISHVAPSAGQMQSIGADYLKSLGTWVFEPVSFFFHDDQPLLPPPLVVLFFIGIFYSLGFLRKSYYYFLFLLAILIPFFSSAITDAVNADHRLIVLLPIGVIFCSVAVARIVSFLKIKPLKILFLGIASVYLCYLAAYFFVNQSANIGRDIHDYLSMDIIYTIQAQEKTIPEVTSQTYCLRLSSANYKTFDYLHYKEQYDYFLPNISINKQEDKNVSDNTIYIFHGSCPVDLNKVKLQTKRNCSNKFNLYCPLNYSGDIIKYFN